MVIAGGGTGGHLFPGIAVAEEFLRRDPGNRILFIGTERGLEKRILGTLGFPLRTIPVEGIKGRGPAAGSGGAREDPRGPFRLLPDPPRIRSGNRSRRGGVRLGAGGPGRPRSWGTATAIAEQNAFPGLTNRILGRFADRIFLSFAASRRWFPDGPDAAHRESDPRRIPRGKTAGRKKRPALYGPDLRGKPGGARDQPVRRRGAGRPGAYERPAPFHPSGGGKGAGDASQAAYREKGFTAEVSPFIIDMAAAYRAADLLICRAGATSIAEITAGGKAAILIPFPFAVNDHQTKNAEILAQAGAAELIREKDLSGGLLAAAIERLSRDPEAVRNMETAARALGNRRAAEEIVDACLALVEDRRRGRADVRKAFMKETLQNSSMRRKIRRIHFVGIGGIGMSGIAEVLLNLGYEISGSDLGTTDITQRLDDMGAAIHRGHDASHIGNADVVVTSTAVRPDNPEVVAAHERGIPVIPRAEMLAELLKMKFSIAVSGSHGKTTTTSMVATLLAHGGLDPTMVIGGKLASIGSNARLGDGEVIVAEADESDGSFLKLSPCLAVITNIDREHLDYYKDVEEIKEAFLQFANIVPFYGSTILCLDDPHVREILPRIKRRVITYGLSPAADYRAEEISFSGSATRFSLRHRDVLLGSVQLNVPGLFNVYERPGGDGGGTGDGDGLSRHPGGACGLHRRTAAAGGPGRGKGDHRGRRLRPSPDGDPGDARRGAAGLARTDHRRLPAPSVHPDAGALRGISDGLRRRRLPARHRHLSRERRADPGGDRLRALRGDPACGSSGCPPFLRLRCDGGPSGEDRAAVGRRPDPGRRERLEGGRGVSQADRGGESR